MRLGRLALLAFAAILVGACGGNSSSGQKKDGGNTGLVDFGFSWEPLPSFDVGAFDFGGFGDLSVTGDGSVSGDGGADCKDKSEPNDTCSSTADAGTSKEGASFKSYSGTLNTSSDVDVIKLKVTEGFHACIPFTGQCYKLTLKVTVPSGRTLKACALYNKCDSLSTCKVFSTSTAGPTSFTTTYLKKGRCGSNDDLTAYVKISSADGKGDCSKYTLEFKYAGASGC